MNIRKCKLCGKDVDFDEPWCEHETMEESAWQDINNRIYKDAMDIVVEEQVRKATKDLLDKT